jgi:NAD(P)H dehydrogenase (quinone)
MNVLVVHAHPEPKSFNGALTRTAIRALREQGHTVEVSDLYAMKWKPAADADDYAGPREDEDYLRIDREQTFAHEAATTACDIVTEQAKVRRADLVLFQYPMWWFGPPAILKGWFDRVFTRSFAYLPGRKYDTGLMAGKLAMVSVTTGTSADTYAPDDCCPTCRHGPASSIALAADTRIAAWHSGRQPRRYRQPVLRSMPRCTGWRQR